MKKLDILSSNSKTQFISEFLSALKSSLDIKIISNPSMIRQACDFLIHRNTGLDYNDDDLIQLKKLQNIIKFKSINSIDSEFITRDKFKQYLFLKENDFRTLKTSLHNEFSYPFVLKTLRGMQGRGVYLIQNEQDLLPFNFSLDCRYLFQEYYKADEYRFYFFLNQSFCVQKSNTHSFKHNLYYQSEFKPVLVKREISQELLRIGELLDFNFYSLDFFLIQDRAYIFDINTSSGIEGIKAMINWQKLRNYFFNVD